MLRQGFKNLLHMALRLEEDALAVCGLPCTSYVFINSDTHGRKKAVPYGDENKSYVCTANLFLVLLLAYFFIVEWVCNLYFKSSSILAKFPSM